ncbi:MAG: flagellar protein FlaG [Lachnospiraceae bacterium]|nr:flagellar protein FlaG [Lachnospiraceae bacterium]
MTYQAQTASKPQAVTPVNTEVPEDGQTVNVDETTASVTRPQPEDDKSGGEAGSQQQPANAKTQQQANTNQAQQQKSEQLKKAVAEMNRRINNSNEEAVFGVHEDTNRIMIKIMDKETKEVIKEFPPEKTLDMIAKIWEMAGILVDEKL